MTAGADGDNSFSKFPSVVLSESGHEIPHSSAHLSTLETVLREHGTDSAMFRSLNPKPFNLRISRYLVIILTLLKMNLRISAHTFILIRSRVWLNDAGIVAHSKTERWLTSTGQVAQNHPDYSILPSSARTEVLQHSLQTGMRSSREYIGELL